MRIESWSPRVMRVLGLVALTFLVAATTSLAHPEEEPPSELPTANVAGLKLTDLNGTVCSIGGTGSPRPVALVFLDTACPIANRLLPPLGELSTMAGDLGVDFFGILSDPRLSREGARNHHAEYSISFPVLFDGSGILARTLEPTHVPEAFVIDRHDRIAYRGRVDDRFADVGTLRQTIREHELRDAMTAVAEEKTPSVTYAAPVGCVFEAWDGVESTANVTYTRDVAPILNAHCVQCHREGEVAPFPLQTYAEARRRARTVASVTQTGFMPPWRAEKDHGRFHDERRMSWGEVEILQAWAKTGAPEGDASDLPEPPQFDESGWALGEPDLVLTMPEFQLPANGPDIFQRFVLPTHLTEDSNIIAMDFRAGDASVAHHAVYYGDTTGRAREIDAQTEEPGYPAFSNRNGGSFPGRFLGVWTPGYGARFLPEGMGIPIAAGTDFVLEMHYHLTGKKTTDASQVALYFADGPVERAADSLIMGTFDLDIPAGDSEYWRHTWVELPTDMTILNIWPHMHLLGDEVEVEATLPDGTTQWLLWVYDYDFRWQDVYVYADPLQLPAGTRIDARVRYDNSADNPHQAYDPPRAIGYGDETTDEMCFVFFQALADDPDDAALLRRAEAEGFTRDGEGNELDPAGRRSLQRLFGGRGSR